ncbi:ZYBA0S12-01838g1_1 [Zygosaccharomyces bailii CLIB 213]|uniref:ZYBA0S12-01838g1_1 n=1 Tax=Zygosaccharomyces bailii (strain CLIB 213 / ATCC 58445 / CBS 680 / BCRC 21525 / NBRC 1098 / NCYC 1416 / NRRL Y-2227) TaxID=1333698 RepID=A0A8J2TAU1_ZYGB2|nr:ZYBA0S12-01838g1_1 [Zygosaccharomyces bailii CLIB 213]
MAKSVRAKSTLRAKSAKCGNEFQKAYDAREARISERRQQDLMNQKMEQLKKNEAEGKMEDAEEKPAKPLKISTSGWRDANHLNYRRTHKKKRKVTKF